MHSTSSAAGSVAPAKVSAFHIQLRSGIWNVKLDGQFYGDYRAMNLAMESVEEKAHSLRARGHAIHIVTLSAGGAVLASTMLGPSCPVRTFSAPAGGEAATGRACCPRQRSASQSSIVTSTRRLIARPAAVSLVATGLDSPLPTELMRLKLTPVEFRYAPTAAARRFERSTLLASAPCESV
jgi:hypothetical protein